MVALDYPNTLSLFITDDKIAPKRLAKKWLGISRVTMAGKVLLVTNNAWSFSVLEKRR
jgi:hypothetical protein